MSLTGDKGDGPLGTGSFVDMLTGQFLSTQVNHESAAETQAYLADKILPSIVIGLQRLLVTVKNKHVDLETGLVKGPLEHTDNNNTETPRVPSTKFNPIIWLAQHLYRHNPKKLRDESFSVLSKSEIAYKNALEKISKQLHDRVKETARLRKERFEALKAEREAEIERRKKLRAEAEKKRASLLQTSIPEMFRYYMASLWRLSDGYLFPNEIDAIANAVGKVLQDQNINLQLVSKSFSSFTNIKEEDFVSHLTDIFKYSTKNHLVALLQAWKDAANVIKQSNQADLDEIYFLPAYGNKIPQVFSDMENLKSYITKDVYGSLEKVPFKPLADFLNTKDSLAYSKKKGQNLKQADAVTQMDSEWKSFLEFAVGQAGIKDSKAAIKDLYERLGKITKQGSQLAYQAFQVLKQREAEQLKVEEETQRIRENEEKIRLEKTKREEQTYLNAQTKEQETQRRLVELQRLFQKLQDLIQMGALKSTFHGYLNMILKNATSTLSNRAAPDSLYEKLSQMPDLTDAPEEKSQLFSYFLETGNKMNESLLYFSTQEVDGFLSDIHGHLSGIESFFVAVQEKIRNRREMENKFTSDLTFLSKRIEIGVNKFCEMSIGLFEKFFRSYYPTYSVYISLLEKPTSAEVSASIFNSAKLRYVACSSKDRQLLLNKTLLPGDGISFDIMAEREPRFVSNVRDPEVPIKLFGVSQDERNKPEGMYTKRGSYYGIPLFHNETFQKESIGVLGMDNIDIYDSTADVAVLKAEDLAVAANAGAKLSEFLDRIDKRQKLTSLALNAMKWTVPTLDVDIDFYLVEHDTVLDDGQKRQVSYMWHVQQKDGATTFDPVSTESFEKIYLWQCVDSKTKVIDKAAYGKGAIAFPMIRAGQVAGVLSVRSRGEYQAPDKISDPAEAIISSEQHKDFEDILTVLGTAVNNIKNMGFGQLGPSILAAEKFDEVSKNSMLFPRLLLQSARESISKMDAAAIAEIKSYRKPPPVIHRVMKCVLFIFGKKRKQLLRWIDVSKLLNADLLKSIVEYDPTTVQKKKKFIMIERELKKFNRTDVRKQGSRPAKEFYEWLLISLQLRKEAVAARKRLKEASSDLNNLSEEAKQAVIQAEAMEEDSDDPDEIEPGMDEEL